MLTNRLAQSSPRVADARDLPGTAMSLERRREMWSVAGLVPALTTISALFVQLDTSVAFDAWGDVEEQFVADLAGDYGDGLRSQLRQGNVVLNQQALVHCIKEVVEFADLDSDIAVDKLGFVQALMSINEELNINATPTTTQWPEAVEQLIVSTVAQQSFAHFEPLELLLSVVDASWRRTWSSESKKALVHDLGTGPAVAFKETMGVELDDFLVLGWIFYNMSRHEGMTRFDPDLLRQFGVPENVMQVFLDHCSLTLGELRRMLRGQRESPTTTPWTRYKLQQFPFVALPDGSLLALRFQYAIQRIFGDHLYLETKHLITAADPKRGSRFASAMNDVFETRVGEVLHRISKYDGPAGGGLLITEQQLKRAWHTKAKKAKICDFAYAKAGQCILIDANNRHLMRKFAEGTGSPDEFIAEIREMFGRTKFTQLTSTIRQFRKHGWNRQRVAIGKSTRFIPLVVAPDAGIPSNEITEHVIMMNAMPLVAEFNETDHFALPPTIISWRDLSILDGLAQNHVDIFSLLVDWRTLSRSGTDIACSFQTYLGQRTDHRAVMSKAEHQRGFDCFEALRRHAAMLGITQLPAHLRAEAQSLVSEGLAGLPDRPDTW